MKSMDFANDKIFTTYSGFCPLLNSGVPAVDDTCWVWRISPMVQTRFGGVQSLWWPRQCDTWCFITKRDKPWNTCCKSFCSLNNSDSVAQNISIMHWYMILHDVCCNPSWMKQIGHVFHSYKLSLIQVTVICTVYFLYKGSVNGWNKRWQPFCFCHN